MNESHLWKKIQALEQQFETARKQSNIDLMMDVATEYLDLKKGIMVQSLDSSVIRTYSRDERRIVRQIVTHDLSFPLNSVVMMVMKLNYPDITPQEVHLQTFNESELEDLSSEHFYSWYSGLDYVQDLIDLGSVVVSAEIDGHLCWYVSEIRSSYVFQQYLAVAVLCRTLLESTIRAIGIRKELIPEEYDTFQFYRDYPPSKLISTVLKGEIKRKVHDQYNELSEIIHGFETVDRDEALAFMTKTFDFVEKMWDYNFDEK